MENRNLQTVSQGIDVNTDPITWELPEGATARLGRGKGGWSEFSSDGRYLIIGTWIGLWWYELATMKPFALWETKRGMISTLKFSSDGAMLATGNQDGQIKVWNVQNHHCLAKMQRMERNDRASELAFSPDEQHLASSGGRYDAIYVWHIETGEQIAKFTVDEELQPRYRNYIPLAFSPDGRFIIAATPENTFSVWDIETGKRLAHLTGHSAIVIALLFSPCGEFLTSIDWDGGLQKWETDKLTTNESRPIRTSMPEATKLVQYTYSADGVLLAATDSETTITVWDVERARKIATLTYKEIVRGFRFSQTGSQLAIGSTGTIQIWEIGDPAPLSPAIDDHDSVCGSVKFSPNGQTLAAGYWSGKIHLRDVQELKLRTIFKCEGLDMIRSIDFSPCGNKLAATSYDKIVRVWDLEKPDAPPTELTGHQAVLYAVAFSPKGDLLVSADSKGVLGLWDVQDNYELQTFTEETDWIWSIAFSPDGKYLVSAHEKEKARLWDIESGEQIAELSSNRPRDATKYKGNDQQIQRILRHLEKGSEDKRTPKAIAFSPDSDLIAGDVLGQIRLWDTTTYEIRMVICLPQGCGRAEALTFSPCGRYLVSGASWLDRLGIDKVSIRLWDVTTGENTATFWSHPTDIQSLAFSPDGTLLASASYDGTILLWDMKPYIPPIHLKSTTK